jgi:hypothetical protein
MLAAAIDSEWIVETVVAVVFASASSRMTYRDSDDAGVAIQFFLFRACNVAGRFGDRAQIDGVNQWVASFTPIA